MATESSVSIGGRATVKQQMGRRRWESKQQREIADRWENIANVAGEVEI